MTEEEKTEYRILHLAAGPLLPILEQRLEVAKNELLRAYQQKEELTAPVAKFAEAHGVLREVKRKIETYETIVEHQGE